MGLQFAQAVGTISWQLTQSNTPFVQSAQGPDSVSQSIPFTVASGYATSAIAKQYALASGVAQNIDLKTQVDLLNITQPLTKAYGIEVVTSGSAAILSPASSGGMPWFFNGTSGLIIDNGGVFLYASANAATVASGASMLSLLPCSGAMTARLIIIGGF